jgi:acetylornithine/N-succinyldiaminopimelate aminotransferase
MSTQVSVDTQASALASSPAVSEAVDALVRELVECQAGITEARPANPDLKQSYAKWLERIGEVKGRPPLYPYVGSGFGNGPLVELADGSVKWDMINGIGVHMFGHCDPDMVATAVRAGLADTIMQGNLQFNNDLVEFGELVIKEASKGSRLRHAFLINSGCMANESALKVCFQKNAPACRVIAFNDCFMGRSTTMAQIGDSAAGRVGIPLNVLVDYLPFYDPMLGEKSTAQIVAQLEKYIERYPRQHACFVLELVQGEGGFNQAPPEFFIALMEICKKHGIAVWCDEVQTFGRTEEMFHFQQLGLGEYVDVVTFGKMSLVCGCLFTEDYNPRPGLLSATFVSSSVAIQVGKRVIQRLRESGHYGANGQNARLFKAFREQALVFIARHPQWFPPVKYGSGVTSKPEELLGGVGGMMRITPFGGARDKIMKALHTMFEDGVIAFYCGHGPYHLRFLPAIGVMKPEQFRDVFAIMEKSFGKV